MRPSSASRRGWETNWSHRSAQTPPIHHELASAQCPAGAGLQPSVALLVGTLTSREREILGLLVHGLTIRRIAQQLCLTYQTVRSHLYSVFVKLGVHTLVEAVRFALEHQVLEGHGILAPERRSA